ncbi:MAG TPA: hypothetical protein VE619_11285, partial [Nitrososphaeraceae archaeon]|nr:hypothetical protein [Nitrososphaeraceae archaeon]
MIEGVNNNILNKSITEKEAWQIIKPVCRKLYDLVNDGNIQFVSGSHNEVNGTYKINLKCSRIHLASRRFKDSIGDIEYKQRNLRIGLRSNDIPVNIFVE